jgi:hypothetical protein
MGVSGMRSTKDETGDNVYVLLAYAMVPFVA